MHRGELFDLEGLVAGEPARARWTHGCLVITAQLRCRAEAIVQEGHKFGGDDLTVVPASLDGGPLPALLTLIRAFDQVTRADLSPRLFGDSGAVGISYASTAERRPAVT